MIEDIIIDNGQQRLGATLLLPKQSQPVPALLFLSGSGPNNRWSEVYGYPFFARLADPLVKLGFAVLTFDKRGVGMSTGHFDETSYEERTADARMALQYLAERPEIDTSRIGVLGHSEGTYIGAMLAADSNLISYMIWLAPAGETVQQQSITELVNNMRINGATEQDISRSEQKSLWKHRLLSVAKGTGTGWLAVELARNYRPDSKLAEFSRRWYHIFDYDPKPFIAKLTIPILAIFGELDSLCPPEENARIIRETLPPAGLSQLTLKIVPRANHLFLPAKTGGTREWRDLPKVMTPELNSFIQEWLLRITTRQQSLNPFGS